MGASGYLVFMGKKQVKKVGASATKATIKKKGAGKGKFTVKAFIKADGKTYKTKASKKAKPRANVLKTNASTYYGDYKYWTCPFVITKITLSGKTYTVTGYAVNNRMWTMKRYHTLSISVRADGKTVASKTLKNVKVGVGKYKSKKMTFKIKGKAGADLANGYASRSTTAKPEWDI